MNWNISRLDSMCSFSAGKREKFEPNETDAGVFSIGGEHIQNGAFFIEDNAIKISSILYAKARRGKIKPTMTLLVKDGATIGKSMFVHSCPAAMVNEHVFALKPIATAPRFLSFLVEAESSQRQIWDTVLGSAQPGINNSFAKQVFCPVPTFEEQQSIAAWLDLQTGRIDQRLDLLNQKRELLRDLKKSVIEQATFRGCNADAKMRDSEIVWLGTVPNHWKTVRLASLFREAANPGIPGLPMLSVSIHSGISDKELDDDELDRKVSRSEDITLYKRVKPGDLVYNQMRAWQGAFGAAKVEGLVSPAYVVARPGKAVVPTFIEYLLRAPAAMEEIRRRSRGITDFRLRLYWDEFKNIRIAMPPKDEQEAVAAFLDRKLSQIDRQMGLIDRLETLLKEQRKAIIHEAVTGKIDLSAYEPPSQEAITA